MTLFELLGLLRKHLWLVIALPLVTAIAVAGASMLLPDEYTATTTMYVLSKQSDEASALTQSDLNAGQMLTNDVATILRSGRVKAKTAEELGLPSLKGYDLSVTSSTTTRVITLSVTGTDPAMTAAVTNKLVETTSDIASEVMQIESVNVIDSASVPTSPSGPRRTLYTMIGFLAGLFAAVAIVVIRDMLDTRIRSGSDVEELIDVPVVGHFPALERS